MYAEQQLILFKVLDNFVQDSRSSRGEPVHDNTLVDEEELPTLLPSLEQLPSLEDSN
jgi:hypothetical protein